MTTATTTKTQEIAALNARIEELQGVGSSWMADWGRVDDEIIRERKAIHDSALDQIAQLQARITELEKFTPAASINMAVETSTALSGRSTFAEALRTRLTRG